MDFMYNNEINQYMRILSEERKRKAQRYRFPIDKINCILGEILLRYVLWIHYSIKDINFEYNAYCKPYLAGKKEIYFNISHSGNWVLCGVSNVPIGVDVEGEKSDFIEIAKRFFSKNEYNYIQNQPLSNQYDTFYKIWTLKESYIKCVGKGLSIPLNSFEFGFSGKTINLYKSGILDRKYLFRSSKIDYKYHVSLCVCGNTFGILDNKICICTAEDLLLWRKSIL